MTYVTHWDDVPARRSEGPAVRVARRDLGRAAGMTASSVKLLTVEPGALPSPAHAHGSDEEFFYVLRGSGLSWQDGVTHEVGEGDVLLHRPAGPAHTMIAGDEGLEALAFGPHTLSPLTRLPRAGVFWAGTWWIADDGGDVPPFGREPADLAGEPGPRPDTTIHFSEGRRQETRRAGTDLVWLDLGRRLGSATTGLRHATIAPSAEGPPPHCHSAEDEIFVVLGGSGEVTLGDETHALRRGSVVGRPAGTGVAHQFRAGAEGLSLLAWGTREPSDMCWYPRSRKVALRGLGVRFRVEPLDYWDGEPE